MDLTSLPPEMLVSILKYTSTKELFRLRKINSTIDSCTKYGNLMRILADSIYTSYKTESEDEIRLYWNSRSMPDSVFPDCQYQPSVLTYNNTGFAYMFQPLLRKIKVLNRIDFQREIQIDTSFLAIIKQNHSAIKNVRKFYSSQTNFKLSKENAKTLIKSFPKLDCLSLVMNTPSNNLHNTEVLGNRKWHLLSINLVDEPYRPDFPELDDEFLLKVVSNCLHFVFAVTHFRSNFTVMGVFNMAKLIASRPASNKQIDLGKLKLGRIDPNQVEELFKMVPRACVIVKRARTDEELRSAGDKYVIWIKGSQLEFLINGRNFLL